MNRNLDSNIKSSMNNPANNGMDNLIQPLHEIREYQDVLRSVREYSRPVSVIGPSDSQKAHICYALCRHSGQKGIYVAYNEMQARKMHEDFSFFLGEDVLFYPSKEIMLYDVEAKSYDAVYQRLRVLDRLARGDFSFIVTSLEAISHKLVSPACFTAQSIEIFLGSTVDLEGMTLRLVTMGYERVDVVEAAGQFAVRGGIIDVFSVDSEQAVRVELFDDEVDSIRFFDTSSQRSVDRLESTRIIPAREIIYPREKLEDILEAVRRDVSAQAAKLAALQKKEEAQAAHGRNAGHEGHSAQHGRHKAEEPAEVLKQRIDGDIDRFRNEYYFPGIDRYIPYLIEEASGLTDYAGGEVLLFIDEQIRQKQRLDNLLLEHYEVCKGLLERGQLLPKCQESFLDFETLTLQFEKRKLVYLNTMIVESQAARSGKLYSIPSRLLGSFQGHMDLLCDSLRDWKSQKSRIIILSGTRGRGERLCETLSSKGIEAVYADRISGSLLPGQVAVTHGSLNKGFEYPAIGFVVVSDKEVFGQDRKARKTATKQKGSKISLFTDLNPGDFVVHQAHGIGQYVGIEKLAVEGVKRDYLKIRYQENGFLYIPTNQLDLVQKYIGSEGRSPKVSKLGGTDWAKTKSRVKESLKELAAELIKLYAQRQAARGFTFSHDTVWQRQFEEQFPYEETDDQLKCIEEIKQDMESGKVMDRLLCGDVGYGKTEVAIRAVFKAVMDGKQVAYLVPTTILAQQQYNSFAQRMRDYPVTVDVISRFRTAAEQKRILKDVKAGNIDVLIGTHRLLQKDIQFKDLGLLVIDEEQRFGVTHKEKLKNMRPDVNVLTLTATPIPRTLHMSLVGIRDISVIEDPPEERYPVQTYVMEHNADVIKDAILREMSRKGQVFYLYNRVRTIELKAAEIQALVPDARVAVAHGQMDERQLEDIMFSFIKGEFDILVCTTIIESGLDMPNVNTIVVEDADRMGLAQLYQIRGRVGRSNRLAYAYITYKKDKVVAEVAEKRLQAIREFTELGSGFKIAMRDMEIRGAGNLLGPEQHGHMETVGYDMYCRLLDEAVRELRGDAPRQEEAEVSIDINLNAYIDDSYIGNESRKIEMYKKIAAIQEDGDVTDIIDELTDRYGDMPEPVSNLVAIAHIKAMARRLGFISVTEKNDSVIFQLGNTKNMNIQAIGKLAAKYKRQLLFNAGAQPYILYKTTGIGRDKLLENIKIVLQDLKSFEVQ